MTWDQLKIKPEETKSQLWRRLKRTEAMLKGKDKEIIALQGEITELEQEADEMKGELKRLRQSNAMLKKHRTS